MEMSWTQICPGKGWLMLCVLLFSGLCSCLHKYHFLEEPKSWHEAKEYCRETYLDLATIDNNTDMEHFIATVGSKYEGKVWIGLHDFPNGWNWSLSDPDFYGEGESDFTNWHPGQPDQTQEYGKLCTFVQEGFWHDDNCSTELAFVCSQRDIVDGFLDKTQKFYFINEMMDRGAARDHCRESYTDLASVRNEQENIELKLEIETRGAGSQKVWIGYYRYSWLWWSDKSSSKFQTWVQGSPNNPNNSCAASVFDANYTGDLEETHCQEKHPFMCHSKTTKLFFKLRALKSSISLNDPGVTDAILNLIKKKMKDHVPREQFEVSWIQKTGENIFRKEKKNTEVEEGGKSEDVVCTNLQ